MILPLITLALLGCGTEAIDPPGTQDTDGTTGTQDTRDSSGDSDPSSQNPDFLADTVEGDPGLESIQSLAFASDGTLAIGDGEGDQLVVIALPAGEITDHRPAIDDIYPLVAEAFGDPSITSVEIWDIAAHPVTSRIYVAAEREDSGEYALFTVDDDVTLSIVDLSQVSHAASPYPEMGNSGSEVLALAWSQTSLVGAVAETNGVTHQMVSISLPVSHNDSPAVTSTKYYHRTHNQWEAGPPVLTLAAYVEAKQDYLAATYTCTPAVRFTPADLKRGSQETVGDTSFDYGGSKQVLDMVITSEGVYATINGMLEKTGSRWDSYAGVRVDRSRLIQSSELNEDSVQMIGGGDSSDKIIHPEASRFSALDGASWIDLIDDTHIVALQQAGLHVIDTSPARLPGVHCPEDHKEEKCRDPIRSLEEFRVPQGRTPR